jgi:hypothetical protein
VGIFRETSVKVEYFVWSGIAITVLLGVLGEFQIRKEKQHNKAPEGDEQDKGKQ